MQKRRELLDKADLLLKEAHEDETLKPVELWEIARWRLSFEVEVDTRNELFRLRQLLDLIKREGSFH
ncbi:hypothetical protein ES703_50938 [subsurface metagenome]